MTQRDYITADLHRDFEYLCRHPSHLVANFFGMILSNESSMKEIIDYYKSCVKYIEEGKDFDINHKFSSYPFRSGIHFVIKNHRFSFYDYVLFLDTVKSIPVPGKTKSRNYVNYGHPIEKVETVENMYNDPALVRSIRDTNQIVGKYVHFTKSERETYKTEQIFNEYLSAIASRNKIYATSKTSNQHYYIPSFKEKYTIRRDISFYDDEDSDKPRDWRTPLYHIHPLVTALLYGRYAFDTYMDLFAIQIKSKKTGKYTDKTDYFFPYDVFNRGLLYYACVNDALFKEYVSFVVSVRYDNQIDNTTGILQEDVNKWYYSDLGNKKILKALNVVVLDQAFGLSYNPFVSFIGDAPYKYALHAPVTSKIVNELSAEKMIVLINREAAMRDNMYDLGVADAAALRMPREEFTTEKYYDMYMQGFNAKMKEIMDAENDTPKEEPKGKKKKATPAHKNPLEARLDDLIEQHDAYNAIKTKYKSKKNGYIALEKTIRYNFLRAKARELPVKDLVEEMSTKAATQIYDMLKKDGTLFPDLGENISGPSALPEFPKYNATEVKYISDADEDRYLELLHTKLREMCVDKSGMRNIQAIVAARKLQENLKNHAPITGLIESKKVVVEIPFSTTTIKVWLPELVLEGLKYHVKLDAEEFFYRGSPRLVFHYNPYNTVYEHYFEQALAKLRDTVGKKHWNKGYAAGKMYALYVMESLPKDNPTSATFHAYSTSDPKFMSHERHYEQGYAEGFVQNFRPPVSRKPLVITNNNLSSNVYRDVQNVIPKQIKTMNILRRRELQMRIHTILMSTVLYRDRVYAEFKKQWSKDRTRTFEKRSKGAVVELDETHIRKMLSVLSISTCHVTPLLNAKAKDCRQAEEILELIREKNMFFVFTQSALEALVTNLPKYITEENVKVMMDMFDFNPETANTSIKTFLDTVTVKDPAISSYKFLRNSLFHCQLALIYKYLLCSAFFSS